jgi:ubiquinone/menaquinone biosynthesis C-methylase UbiE
LKQQRFQVPLGTIEENRLKYHDHRVLISPLRELMFKHLRCTMSDSETGQVTRSPAEVYEEFFLPALLQQWTSRVADAAGIQSGERVLDVACGTGVLARAVAERVGPSGAVIGVDINEGMLAVARRKAPAIAWKQGRAEALPLDSESFDAVVSQFGLMFFQDRRVAL